MANTNMEGTGVKHTKHCNKCNTNKPLSEYQKHFKKGINVGQAHCRECRNNSNTWSAKTNPTSNPERMYVNGKYVPKDHPLYKAGRFKTFEGAAFSALSGYEKSSEGYVYVITNPCWKGWIKVGMAIDAEDRCKQYQTSSPFRDYALRFKKYFDDRRSAEQQAHKKIKNICKDNNGEWFKVSISEAKEIIQSI